MFIVLAHDNDLRFFKHVTNAPRCSLCGLLLNKWTHDLSNVPLRRAPKIPLSSSYDGVTLATQAFIDLYSQEQMTGLRFTPLRGGIWSVRAERAVQFDAAARKTRFSGLCELCGQHRSVVGMTPAVFRAGTIVTGLEFARSDLEFGSDDAKSPLFVCGDEAANRLRDATFEGIHVEPAHVGAIPNLN